MKVSLTITLSIGRNGEDSHHTSLTPVSWNRIRKQVKRTAHGICHYCGRHAEHGHVDHVIPLSKGGTDDIHNLVWSCPACNQSKGGGYNSPFEDKGMFEHFLHGAYHGKGTNWRTWQDDISRLVWDEYTHRLMSANVAIRKSPTAPLTLLGDYDTAKEKLAEWLPVPDLEIVPRQANGEVVEL